MDNRSSIGQQASHQTLRLLTLGGILFGFALRLYRLGAESLWYDETVSVVLAQKSIPALLRHTAGDIHPPGYYLLLHYWQALVAPTPAFGLEFLYAWPSLCCGLLIVALLFALGRTLATPRLACAALWLAAIHPYHIWYSQEVRMYTLGAMLSLLCLWAMLIWWRQESQRRWQRVGWLLSYALAAAAGLYTLYYFLFVLVTCNGIVLLLWLRQRRPSALGAPLRWLGAQVGVLVLWLPWLPVFWRQATTPPVPPWRAPWQNGAQLLAAAAESASALLSGQSAPAATAWWWLLLFLMTLFAAYFYYTNKNRSGQGDGPLILISYLLVPLGLLYAITLWVTPLYHVRYLFIYAPPVILLMAAALLYSSQRHRLLGIAAVLGIVTLHSWSLYNFWFTPAFQTDDHRAAVAGLAQAWRPGDAILVNAGWVYTALRVYWPTTLVGVDAATPPSLQQIQRLIDYRAVPEENATNGTLQLAPTVVRTGSVEGAPTLGWGDPSSDFFAMSELTTNKALFTLAQAHSRIWHYRLYDTVSDPLGLIRTWFDYYNMLLAETPIAGRDYLRIQLYQTAQGTAAATALIPFALPDTYFAGNLRLERAALAPATVEAGNYLYTQLVWQLPVDRAQLPPVVSFSLRLYTAEGHLLAQADETPPLPLAVWPADYTVTLALPVPVATPPGAQHLVLITYDPQTGAPLAVLGAEPQRRELRLGPVQIAPAIRVPIIPTIQATFDYIDLVSTRLATMRTPAVAPLEVELVWRPQANAYRDTYLAQLVLTNTAGAVVGQWEAALGGWNYPSGEWPPLIPVRDWRFLPLDPATPPGAYTLTLRVLRNSDRQVVPARLPHRLGWGATEEVIVVGSVQVE